MRTIKIILRRRRKRRRRGIMTIKIMGKRRIRM